MNPSNWQTNYQAPNPVQTKEWAHFLEQLSSVPKDYPAAKIPCPSLGISLFDFIKNLSSGFRPSPVTFPSIKARYQLRPNIDGGDCLLQALEDDPLSLSEVKNLRQKLAAELHQMPEQLQANAIHITARLLQTPPTKNQAIPLMAGRPMVPNHIFASLQEVPGIYAGENEIIQWCSLKHKNVLCVYLYHPTLSISAKGKKILHPSSVAELQELFEDHSLGLFYRPGHWDRILELY